MNKQIFKTLLAAACFCAAAMTVSGQTFQANYDEAKAGTYTLPDPLVMNDGSRVANAGQWRKRRQEILRLFETNVYGRSPAKYPAIYFEEKSRDDSALNGTAMRREITIWLLGKRGGPSLSLLIYSPKKKTGPSPVFLGMSFGGNHAVNADPGIALSTRWMRETRDDSVVNNRATEKTRGVEASRWTIEKKIARGYAVATFYCGDLFPDHNGGLKDSIVPSFFKSGQTAPEADEWNALGAWAWGLSRAVDYLERDREIDPKRIILIGHSRLGKAALWAGAQDERFAIVISNESGEGGAAIMRRNFGETVARINTSFPYWFCANFKKFNDRPADLPVDAHMLISLIAPRPVYIASAVEDQWADPRGEFLSGKAASPVYQLLGKEGLGSDEMPGLNQPIMKTIGYHIRAGKHDVTDYDWEQYMNFADKHLRKR